MSIISKETFEFLTDLKSNNNREWFTEYKPRYQQAHENVIAFTEALMGEMRKVDHIENESAKKTLFRIYRDVRFSKDKSPYKTHFAGSLKRATKWLRGGYYFHIEPGNNTIAAGGFFSPSAGDMKIIRDDIAHNDAPLRSILEEPQFVETFGGFQGEVLKTAPKGYPKDHKAIDLLRHKQFYVRHVFSDEEVLSEDFAFSLVKTFLILRPYFDHMSEILTAHLED